MPQQADVAGPWDDMVVVGRVARTHGNRGQVIVNPETDFLEDRFRIGSVLQIRRHDLVEALTLTTVRFQRGRPIIGLKGIETMNEAEALVNAELRVPSELLHALPAGVFYQHDLVGCLVRTTAGKEIGCVKGVEGSVARSRLVVEYAGGEVLIPMAGEICVGIDIAGRAIVVEPPEGLLELNAPSRQDRGTRVATDRGV